MAKRVHTYTEAEVAELLKDRTRMEEDEARALRAADERERRARLASERRSGVTAGFTHRHTPETPERTALREQREREIAAHERALAETEEGRREAGTEYRLTYRGSGGARQRLPLRYTKERADVQAAELRRMGYPEVEVEPVAAESEEDLERGFREDLEEEGTLQRRPWPWPVPADRADRPVAVSGSRRARRHRRRLPGSAGARASATRRPYDRRGRTR
jgi:hypothetical protein